MTTLVRTLTRKWALVHMLPVYAFRLSASPHLASAYCSSRMVIPNPVESAAKLFSSGYTGTALKVTMPVRMGVRSGSSITSSAWAGTAAHQDTSGWD